MLRSTSVSALVGLLCVATPLRLFAAAPAFTPLGGGGTAGGGGGKGGDGQQCTVSKAGKKAVGDSIALDVLMSSGERITLRINQACFQFQFQLKLTPEGEYQFELVPIVPSVTSKKKAVKPRTPSVRSPQVRSSPSAGAEERSPAQEERWETDFLVQHWIQPSLQDVPASSSLQA